MLKLNINHGGKINILQITDMQVIDSSQRRRPDRISEKQIKMWAEDTKDFNLYDHIKFLVNKTTPDLILITGDIIYGEFDDSGRSFDEFVKFMDSFEIPWAPVFGNHDNESDMGTDWQCEQFEKSEYCLFERGNVFGNGNYVIGIYQNGILKRAVFMTDSNGCGVLGISAGFRDNQLEWIKTEADNIHKDNPETPFFICCHIPPKDFYDAYVSAGYMSEPDKSWRDEYVKFELGKDISAKTGDFGKKDEGIVSMPPSVLPLLKECGFDGFFVGHWHKINTSVMYEGIRFTFGLKTGYYDYHDEVANGGTLIELNDKDFSVKHIYYKRNADARNI